MNPTVLTVTNRIRERSEQSRRAYLQQLDVMAKRPGGVDRMGCANVARACVGVEKGGGYQGNNDDRGHRFYQKTCLIFSKLRYLDRV